MSKMRLLTFKTHDGAIFAFIAWKKGVEPAFGLGSGPSTVLSVPIGVDDLVIKAQGKPGSTYKFAVIETDHSIDEGKTLHSDDRTIPQSGEDRFEYMVDSKTAKKLLVAIDHLHPIES